MKKILIPCIILFILTSCSFNNKKDQEQTETDTWAITTDFEEQDEDETATWEEIQEQKNQEQKTSSWNTNTSSQNTSSKGETPKTQTTNSVETTKKEEEEKIVKEFEKEIDGLFNLIEKDGE